MEFGFSVQQLFYQWILPSSQDTALLNGNNLGQRVVMNTQLSQVIDSMGLASAVVITLTLTVNTTIGLRFTSADYFSWQTFSKWSSIVCQVFDESVYRHS